MPSTTDTEATSTLSSSWADTQDYNNNYNNNKSISSSCLVRQQNSYCEITNLIDTAPQRHLQERQLQWQDAHGTGECCSAMTTTTEMRTSDEFEQQQKEASSEIELIPNTPFLEVNIRPIQTSTYEQQQRLQLLVNNNNLQCFLFNKNGVLTDVAHENNPRIHNGTISLKQSPSILTLNLDLEHVSSAVKMIGIAFQFSLSEQCDETTTTTTITSTTMMKTSGASVQFIDDKNRVQYSIQDCLLTSLQDNDSFKVTDDYIPVLSAILYRSSLLQWSIIPLQICYNTSSSTSAIVKEFQQLFEKYNLLATLVSPRRSTNDSSHNSNNDALTVDKSSGLELDKGEDFEIDSSVDRIIISGGWKSSVNVDMALGAYDREMAEVETGNPVFYGNREVFDGAIVFREATAGMANVFSHKSFLHIHLSKVPSHVNYMLICMTVADRTKSFMDIEDPYLIVSSMNDGAVLENLDEEHSNSIHNLCNFILDRSCRQYETSDVTAYLMANLYRSGSSWIFKAMGTWADGRRVPDTFRSLCSLSRVINLQENALLAIDINIPEARDLKAFDLNGYSDPYFKLFINGTHVFTSDTVMKSLNPRWEKCNYKVTIPAKSSGPVEIYDIRVELWDFDTITSDDFMGYVNYQITLSNTCTKFEEIHRWYELMPEKSNWRYSKSMLGFVQIDSRFELKAKDTLVDKWILKVLD